MSDNYQPLRVIKKQLLTPDVALFDLASPDESPLPTFTPGAHITVKTPKGLPRSYSLCGLTSDSSRWQIAVKGEKAGRGGSLSMFEDLKSGDLLAVRPWLNQFELKENAKSYLFIAGGIGITPIMSMMVHLLSRGQRNFQLIYCTRDEGHTPFIETLSQPEWKDLVKIHHDQGDLTKSLDLWPILENPNGADVYCCGPTALMDSVKDMSGHWPNECIHFESFGTSEQKHEENKSFQVVLKSSGKTIEVPADVSILDALKANGVSVMSSCESGTCGSCRTGLVSGQAEHRDYVLMDSEKDQSIMVCVSRAKSPSLVLDL
jgi:phthalate 4,5-dioxygenase reductase subunit